jgi:hypothetical protein
MLATGIEQIQQTFMQLVPLLKAITHDHACFNYVHSGDTVVVEGTSSGIAADDTPFAPALLTPGAGATSSRSATGRSNGCSSTSTPTTSEPTLRASLARPELLTVPPRQRKP